GDPITLTTDAGEVLQYVVTQGPTVVSPNDVGVLNYFGDDRLTLTTCNPRFSSTSRLVVVALLREPKGTSDAPVTAPAGYARRSSRPISGGSVGWNLLYLLPVLLMLGLMVLLGFANKRAAHYYGRVGRWLVLVPVWVAVTYLLFGFLTSLLPTTL
ncbi:MAG: sortase, partial [Acidimicrobiales bacterium]